MGYRRSSVAFNLLRRLQSTGHTCNHPVRVPLANPVLHENCAPIGPEILSSTGAGLLSCFLEHLRTPVLYSMCVCLRAKGRNTNNLGYDGRIFVSLKGVFEVWKANPSPTPPQPFPQQPSSRTNPAFPCLIWPSFETLIKETKPTIGQLSTF